MRLSKHEKSESSECVPERTVGLRCQDVLAEISSKSGKQIHAIFVRCILLASVSRSCSVRTLKMLHSYEHSATDSRKRLSNGTGTLKKGGFQVS